MKQIAFFAAAVFGALIGSPQVAFANLIGTSVFGNLNFASGVTNFYDPTSGGVPASGYQNSPSNSNSPTVLIVGGNEFANGSPTSFDLDVTSFSDLGFIFQDTVTGAGTGINNSIKLTLVDNAFAGISEISNNFPGLTYGISGDVITVNIPSQTVSHGQVFTASFSVTSVPEPSYFFASGILILGLVGV